MLIKLKKKYTLQVDEFQFRCSIGKNGLTKNKHEGDFCTPKGTFKLTELFYRHDRVNLTKFKINKKKIFKNMGWCNESTNRSYNKLIKIKKNIRHEKLFRRDTKYDYIIVLDFNRRNTKNNKGSAIFLHITKDYKPTAGCVAISRHDFEILLKLLKKNTYIKIS